MRTPLVCAALVAALLPTGAGAQTLSLTESEALARLSAESPRVQAARAGVAVARADVLAAARWPNPRVTFNREAVSGIAEDMLMVTQALPISGRRGLEVRAASARVEASAGRADDQVRRLRADLRLAYTRLWEAQMRERELIEGRNRVRELARILTRREADGDAAGFDTLRAEREVLDLETQRSLAVAARLQAQAELISFFTEAPAAAAIEAAPVPAPRAALPAVPELVAQAQSRGALVAMTHEREAAQWSEQAARRRRIPEPEIVGGTKSSNAGAGDVGSIVSLHVVLPLFDRAAPERAAAQARAAQVRAEQAALTQSVGGQIAAWHAAVIERRAAADGYRAAVSAGADRIEQIAQVSYDAGERGILELLDAYRTAASARLRIVELEASAREAEIELEFVSGWELP